MRLQVTNARSRDRQITLMGQYMYVHAVPEGSLLRCGISPVLHGMSLRGEQYDGSPVPSPNMLLRCQFTRLMEHAAARPATISKHDS